MSTAERTSERDLRIDFFRGLALCFIFIDHVPGNSFGHFTLRNFGFADAAELFIFLAGFSAVLAYGKFFDRGDEMAGLRRIGARIGTIYAWHIGLILISVVLLATAGRYFANDMYVGGIGVQGYLDTPAIALSQALMLFNQPNLLNILPVYVVLMAWFPLMYMLVRRSPSAAFAVSFAIWLAANAFKINLPSLQGPGGTWFFNPFAWQFLITIGIIAAVKARTATPNPVLVGAAAIYALFAFLVAAPWSYIPGLEKMYFMSRDALGWMNKSDLSPWRLAHVLALAYLAWALIAPRASWLKSPAAEAVARCGRHSLEVFVLGVILSLLGWIAINESQSTFSSQVLVTSVGLVTMGWGAWFLAERKAGRLPGLFAPPQPIQASSH